MVGGVSQQMPGLPSCCINPIFLLAKISALNVNKRDVTIANKKLIKTYPTHIKIYLYNITMTTAFEIESLIKDNKRFRFELELSQTSNVDRKTQITNILKTLNEKIEEPVNDKHKKMFDALEKEIYKQPWNKLKSFHRDVKIKEFVEKTYTDNPKKPQILELLLEALGNGELNTMKKVSYDTTNSQITKITVLCEPDDLHENYYIKSIKPRSSGNMVQKSEK